MTGAFLGEGVWLGWETGSGAILVSSVGFAETEKSFRDHRAHRQQNSRPYSKRRLNSFLAKYHREFQYIYAVHS